jgi:hypothetical protein
MRNRTPAWNAEFGELRGNRLSVSGGADLLVDIRDAAVDADVEGPSRREGLIFAHHAIRQRRRLRGVAQNRKVDAERLGKCPVRLGRIDAGGEVRCLERPDLVATLTE